MIFSFKSIWTFSSTRIYLIANEHIWPSAHSEVVRSFRLINVEQVRILKIQWEMNSFEKIDINLFFFEKNKSFQLILFVEIRIWNELFPNKISFEYSFPHRIWSNDYFPDPLSERIESFSARFHSFLSPHPTPSDTIEHEYLHHRFIHLFISSRIKSKEMINIWSIDSTNEFNEEQIHSMIDLLSIQITTNESFLLHLYHIWISFKKIFFINSSSIEINAFQWSIDRISQYKSIIESTILFNNFWSNPTNLSHLSSKDKCSFKRFLQTKFIFINYLLIDNEEKIWSHD